MGIRFRKRIKILPGVHINLSRSGISTSLGVRGASITKGYGQTRTNLGIPGSGISHNAVTGDTKRQEHNTDPEAPSAWAQAFNFIGSFLVGALIGLLSAIVRGIFSPSKRRRR